MSAGGELFLSDTDAAIGDRIWNGQQRNHEIVSHFWRLNYKITPRVPIFGHSSDSNQQREMLLWINDALMTYFPKPKAWVKRGVKMNR